MKYYLTILFFGLLIFHSYGESKPKVELIFKIDDPLYKMQYGNELSSLESKIQQGLCVIFNKQLSFIDFTPEESDDKFIISLHNIFKNSTDISTPKDLVFFFDFNGPNVKPTSLHCIGIFKIKVNMGKSLSAVRTFLLELYQK